VWVEFDRALVAAATGIPTATVVDAGRPVRQVADDVRNWVNANLPTPAS
jgi:hypothetical protein